MAATPKNATLTFVGASGNIYSIDVYISDVAGAPLRFSPTGAAGSTSETYFRTPEPVVLTDISVESGLADTKGCYFTQDAATRNGTAIRWANFLNSLAFRPRLNIAFPAGALVGGVQF